MRPGVGSVRRAFDALLVVAFLAALAAPEVRRAGGGPDRAMLERERRSAAPPPRLGASLAALRTFPGELAAWYADAFGFRPELLHARHLLRWSGFDLSPTDRMVRGREGWIFYAGEQSLEATRGAIPLRPDELAEWRALLEERRAAALALGARYLFVVAPDKQSVYPDLLPDAYRPVGPSRLDQLVEALRGSPVEWLDLRPALVAERAEHPDGRPLYNRLGTHWSARGVLVAYRALAERLAALVPGLEPIAAERFSTRPSPDRSDSWIERLYLEGVESEEMEAVELRDGRSLEREAVHAGGVAVELRFSRPGEGPRLVCHHDSFLLEVRSILAQHFASALFRWSPDFDLERVAQEHPDLVLDAFVERCLVTQSPFAGRLMDQPALRLAFWSSRLTCFVPDRGRAGWGLEPYLDATAEAIGPNLSVRLGRGGALLLPEMDCPAGRRRVLRLELLAPGATELELLYQTSERPRYGAVNVIRRTLVEGRNEVYLDLRDPRLQGRLLLRPGRARGRYVLRELEIRAVQG